MIRSRSDLKRIRRLVVKIGSSLLTDVKRGVNEDAVDRFVAAVAGLKGRGLDVAVVSSGAVALGRVSLAWLDRDLSLHEKQAAAAVGQPLLMRAYSRAFARHGIQVAQMLLTKDDLRNRRRYLNASNTSAALFAAGVVPIVNENDTVVVEEIKFGDNDKLGALVGLLIDADHVVMLTDVDGLHDRDPLRHADARRISVVEALTPEIMAMAGASGSVFGTGGMASKLHAARIATTGGVSVSIVNGHDEDVLERWIAGADVGTLFLCGRDRQSRRKHWIAEVLRPQGRIVVDAGAARALLEAGGSLLPVGMTAVAGVFDKGECVEIVHDGKVIARGLVNYNADELRRLIGVSSDRIASVLGYRDFSSVVHRDNLVLMVAGGER